VAETNTEILIRSTGRSWLLVLDNVEKYRDIHKYLPYESRGSVLITTRYTAQAELCLREHRAISTLSLQDSKTLFAKLLGWIRSEDQKPADEVINALPTEEKQAVNYVLGEMDGLVLGIQQMAALARFQDTTDNLAKFAQRYRNKPHSLHEKDVIAGHTLATLWTMSFDEIYKSANAWTLLEALSFMQPDEIPVSIFLLEKSAETPAGLKFCKDEDE